MAESTIILTLIGMAAVTYLPRLLPAWFLRNRKLPPFVVAWLKYVPVAVLSALLLPSLLIQDKQLNFQPGNLYLWAAIPAIWVAWRKKSLFGTVITGMLVVALARWLFHL